MSERAKKLQEFQNWVRKYIKGDEKGESQTFLDHLFVACGHVGHKEAGATFEYRVRRKGQSTKYADLVWGNLLLLEMKKRGEKLSKHRDQIFDYWLGLTPNRPQYVILCNFDEFWIYDFNSQIEAPVDIVLLDKLHERFQAISFLFPEQEKPVFKNDLVEVTREAADSIATVLTSIIQRGAKSGDIDRETAQRFMLQCVFALFAEDIELLPKAYFTRLLDDCLKGESTYDVLGGLFRQMDRQPTKSGRYKGIRHFNGGLFAVEAPIELTHEELTILRKAADQDWKNVQPAIFGTIFTESVLEPKRHAFGAHFTPEADIAKVIIPTIDKPWRDRMEKANFDELMAMRDELSQFKVLDPACGSGNFLYVAYRFLKRIEADLLNKIWSYKNDKAARVPILSTINTKQFFGIDINPFAVELAKVTLVIGKKLALDEFYARLDKKRESKEGTDDKVGTTQIGLRLELDEALPLDNIDDNFSVHDAVLNQWPKVNAIIGNPPYQSLNKAEKKLLKAAQAKYPEVPKRADYCVYWFRRAHDQLPPGGRAGLIGTNSIRQTTSRKASLDYIIKNGGTITEAVSSQVWPGKAVVHVSIVNWVKGKQPGKKILYTQVGDSVDSPWDKAEVDEIHGGLSVEIDLSSAFPLKANGAGQPIDERLYGQGQTHNHEGFLLKPKQAAEIAKDKESSKVLRPYLIGDDLLGDIGGLPSRYAIDLNQCDDLTAAQKYRAAYDHLIDAGVLSTAEENAVKQILSKCEDFEAAVSASKKAKPAANAISKAISEFKNSKRSALEKFPDLIRKLESINTRDDLGLDAALKTLRKPGDRLTHLKTWWHFWRDRAALIERIENSSRYIVCSRHLRRPIFEFIDPSIRPNDALQAFAFEDDYSFGILHSRIHASWFTETSGSIKRDSRYTPTQAFLSFPWPQKPTLEQVRAVAWAATKLRKLRWDLMKANNWNYRKLYEEFDTPGSNKLREAHAELDNVVMAAYGMDLGEDPLAFLLTLNAELHALEDRGKTVQGPGLPSSIKNPASFITDDRIQMPHRIGLRVAR